MTLEEDVQRRENIVTACQEAATQKEQEHREVKTMRKIYQSILSRLYQHGKIVILMLPMQKMI